MTERKPRSEPVSAPRLGSAEKSAFDKLFRLHTHTQIWTEKPFGLALAYLKQDTFLVKVWRRRGKGYIQNTKKQRREWKVYIPSMAAWYDKNQGEHEFPLHTDDTIYSYEEGEPVMINATPLQTP